MNYPVPQLVAGLSGIVMLAGCAIMPEPITRSEQQTSLDADKQVIFAKQEPILAPISVYEAMARALKYNLNHRVKMMEHAVADGQSDLAKFNLLPDLIATAGYRGRDNYNASNSRNAVTGAQQLQSSTSQDRSRKVYDFTFSWNVLDFGVSYFQAKQDANRVLVAEETRRKTAQLLMQDVRTAFWRMAGTQQLEGEIDKILTSAKQALKDAQGIESERLSAPLSILQYEKDLLEIIRKLEELSETLRLAKTELASLLGISPSQKFELKLPENNALKAPELSLAIDKMEEMALQLRPELREEIYNNRITAEETHKAILRLLPGIEFRAGYNYDNNSYLLNNNWLELSGIISNNLMELVSAPARFSQIDAQEKLGDTRRLSVYMAVLTQVHLSYQQFLVAGQQYKRTQELDEINQKISKHITTDAENDAKTELERIRATTNALMSRLQLLEAYAGIQSSLGRVYVSLGLDPLPDWIENHNINTLASSIEAVDKNWQAGQFPPITKPAADTLSATDLNAVKKN
ncbi:outer membrane protein TolC [Methylobacter tundripaludum]|uniref:Outer membrane protein TolC n=1 Tax=Methylobacter tundripaludum TaxID=173365 RepID=A0A2S6GXY6_9GAMM|nr:TolC family protein [Methylobacter tundripaludum]PPK70046.1 outer membrane protein TolC [Methylobacter tundripaludum]